MPREAPVISATLFSRLDMMSPAYAKRAMSDSGKPLLAVHLGEQELGITSARGGAGWDRAFDRPQIIGVQLDLDRVERFGQPPATARTDERHDVLPPRQHPCDRRLRDL